MDLTWITSELPNSIRKCGEFPLELRQAACGDDSTSCQLYEVLSTVRGGTQEKLLRRRGWDLLALFGLKDQMYIEPLLRLTTTLTSSKTRKFFYRDWPTTNF